MHRQRPLDLGEVKLAEAYATTARVYRVHWPHTWAIAIVHDVSGCLSLVTDHGNWSYRWHPDGLGKRSLHAFLAETDAGYVLHKVMPSEQRERVSIDGTIENLKRRICEVRRELGCRKEEARDAWDALTSWDPEDLAGDIPDEVHGVVSQAWESCTMEETPAALAFRAMWPSLRELIGRG